jgi:uncharacterized protein (TIGR02145 family)
MKKIIVTLVLVISSTIIFAQTMVVKKSDGTYQEIAITTAVELSFYGPCVGPPTVTDSRDSKVYNTVQIGSQCWLKENLNVGTMINSTTGGDGSGNQTNNSTIEKYCYSDLESNCTTYGGLYQWAEAVQYQNGATNTTLTNLSGNVQGICPTGWHIPTYVELQTLGSAVSSNSNALKAVGQGTGGGAGTNTSGFSALMGGLRYSDPSFIYLGDGTPFWSTTESDVGKAYDLVLLSSDNSIPVDINQKEYGFSVRCCKD